MGRYLRWGLSRRNTADTRGAHTGLVHLHEPLTLAIERDDLTRDVVRELVVDHLREMAATSEPESMHALDLDGLRDPTVTFWTAWEDRGLAGCCALKDLGDRHGEIKSMRTVPSLRGRGIAASMLEHLLAEARGLGWERLSLETGSQDVFAPARRLYARYGFVAGPPFGDYRLDPASVYMTRDLTAG